MNKTSIRPLSKLSTTKVQRGQLFGYILLGALLSFEIFNFGTTEFALHDLLGDLRFMGVRWATVLSIAFCGIDFAGIARIFTPEQGADEPAEVWYLFGAWLLAAAMNAMLTWWGVSVAMLQHPAAGSQVLSQATLMKAVPIFVAFMVWLTRVLIIGAFSIAGERIFSMADKPKAKTSYQQPQKQTRRPFNQPRTATAKQSSSSFRSSPKPSTQNSYATQRSEPSYEPTYEPTYHPVGMAAQSKDNNQPPWRS